MLITKQEYTQIGFAPRSGSILVHTGVNRICCHTYLSPRIDSLPGQFSLGLEACCEARNQLAVHFLSACGLVLTVPASKIGTRHVNNYKIKPLKCAIWSLNCFDVERGA